MEHHVFAWLAGFGRTLMPYAPFRFEQVPGQPRSVRVRHFGPDGEREATVTVGPDGAVDVASVADPDRVREILDVLPGAAYPHWTTGAAYDHWRVETAILTFRWPAGFALRSLPGIGPPVFDLPGPGGSLLWIQGPMPAANAPSPLAMEGPGQRTDRIVETPAGLLVELAFEHGGEPWRMFHCRVDRGDPPRRSLAAWLPWRRRDERCVCFVTAQTPELHTAEVRGALLEVAASLTPRLPEP